jgi:hypothetical protein
LLRLLNEPDFDESQPIDSIGNDIGTERRTLFIIKHKKYRPDRSGPGDKSKENTFS